MREADQLHAEGPALHLRPERDLFQARKLHAVVVQLAAQEVGGEAGSEDGALQPLGEIGHGTEVILVGVGEHEAAELVAQLGYELYVGRCHIHAGKLRPRKNDPAIHHQPAPGVAVEVEIHPDLAAAAERNEQEFVRSGVGVILPVAPIALAAASARLRYLGHKATPMVGPR